MSKRNDDFFIEKKPWSVVKDSLLACYLKPYFQKVLHTRRSISYVDCFAGAGKFDDGTDGSPIIALKIIRDCLTQTKIQNGRIDSFFIEAHHTNMLTENLKGYPNARVIPGKYENEIQPLLNSRRWHNIFLYIDPYGVKELDFDFLASCATGNFNSVEFLLNLNSVGFLRVAFAAAGVDFKNEADLRGLDEYDGDLPKSKSALTKTANNIAGGDYWKNIVADYRNGKFDFYGAEERFVAEYCRRLSEHYRYVLNMQIKSKRFGQLPKYRMIHTTNHPDGALLMAENILKREDLMREMLAGKQLSLFGNCSTTDVEKILSEYLPHIKMFERLNVVLAKFFCAYGVICSANDLTNVLKKFEVQRKIIVERNPPTTVKTGKPTTFWQESKGNILKLRWNT